MMDPGHAGFVTGRAWEDLSEILLTMEELELGVEETLFGQYLQEEETALEFAFYYRVYEKWKRQLEPDQILAGGHASDDGTLLLPDLPFDERLCIVWLLLQRLLSMGTVLEEQQKLSDSLGFFAESLPDSKELQTVIKERLAGRQKGLQVRKENGLLSSEEEEREKRLARIIRACAEKLRLGGGMSVFTDRSREEAQRTREQQERLASGMEHASAFLRGVFGEGQELTVLLTGLTEHPVCRELMKRECPELWQEAGRQLDAEGREEELRRKLQNHAREE